MDKHTDKKNQGRGQAGLHAAMNRSFERTQKVTGASAMEIFCAGLSLAIMGLILSNTTFAPVWLQNQGGHMMLAGLVSMLIVRNKL